jgi:hypothetical protein
MLVGLVYLLTQDFHAAFYAWFYFAVPFVIVGYSAKRFAAGVPPDRGLSVFRHRTVRVPRMP